MKPIPFSVFALLGPFLILCLSGSLLAGKEWTTKISTDEGSHVFGGPLLDEEKPWVGKWEGTNENDDTWRIFRRPNHVYTIEIYWKEEGKVTSFYGHGLWAVKDGKFFYCDVLDEQMDILEGWPVEVEGMIPHEDYLLGIEKIKSVGKDKIVTSAEDSGDSVEKKVESFQKGWIITYDKPDPIKEKQLFDRIVLARIRNNSDMVAFLSDPAYPAPHKLAGYWRISSDDPDDSVETYEVLRRADGTHTTISGDYGGKGLFSHSLWSIRNGRYYEAEFISGDKVVSFEEGFLFWEKVVRVGDNALVTQWVDPERKTLLIFPLIVTVTDQRIKEFKSKALAEEAKKKSFTLKVLMQRIKEADKAK